MSAARTRLWGALALAALLALALWFRWRFAQSVGLHVDEFTTLWAAGRTLEQGVPRMPSGVLYTRGLLNTYAVAGVAAIAGLAPLAGRLLSVVFSLGTVAATFAAGRREWDGRVGWLAALGLALLPEAVEWGARARFYAQLTFFVLLAVWAAWAAIQPVPNRDAPASWRRHLTFAALFTLALFSQEETLLLYPALLLAVLFWRGGRYLLRPPVFTAHAICVAAIALRALLEIAGQPGYFQSIQAERPYLSLAPNVGAAWAAYGPLLVSPARLPWTILGLLGVGAALASLPGAGWRLDRLARFHQATLFFALQFAAVLAVLLLLAGSAWREARYLLIVQPFWLLVGAAGAVWLIDAISSRAWWRRIAFAALIVAAIALAWLPATRVPATQSEGYDAAFAWVAAQRQPGDIVISPQPPACAFVLGTPCDYYASQREHEPYVIARDGVPVDRWTGAPLLDTAEQLEQAIRDATRVWFVTDGLRLGRRFDTDFLTLVVTQFDKAFEERGVMALVAEGQRAPLPPAAESPAGFSAAFGPLTLARWQHSAPASGAPLDVLLLWERAAPVERQINTSLRVVDAGGTIVAQADGPPARGMVPTVAFAGALLPDPKRLDLPAEMTPGRYRIELVAYNAADGAADGAPLNDAPLPIAWFRIGPPITLPARVLDITWDNGLRLVGADDLPAALDAGNTLPVRLVWAADARIPANLTATVQLLGPDGMPIAQHDRAPQDGFYPTSAWSGSPDDLVDDVYPLLLPANLAAGDYRLVVAWYDPATGARVPLAGGENAAQIAVWSVP